MKEERDAYFDNAKCILVFLVVLQHATAYIPESHGILTATRNWLAIWMMPCFCIISGFFSQRFVKKDKQAQGQTILTYLGFYLFAQIMNIFFDSLVLKIQFSFSLVQPKSTLWYLTSLIIWHMILTFLGGYPKKWLIILSVFWGAFAGYESTLLISLFSLRRAIPFFPFFILGYCLDKEYIMKMREWKWRYTFGISLLLISFFIVFLASDKFSASLFIDHAFYENSTNILFSGIPWLVWINAIISYFVSSILSISFLCLVVGRNIPYITNMGTRSLQIYIYHRFPLYILYTYFRNSFSGLTGAIIVILVFSAIGVFASIPILEYPFKKIKEFSFRLASYNDIPK